MKINLGEFIAKKYSLATVESLTGGLLAANITKISGASTWFKGSLVTYQTQIKEKIGVNTSKGVINPSVALQMSSKGKEFFDVDVCVSLTGNAGPSAMEDKPVGLVFIAINENVYKLQFEGNRDQIRNKCINFVVEKLNLLTLA